MGTAGAARRKDAHMQAKNKLIAVASLAAPLLIGGAAGVAAAALPPASAPEPAITTAAHTAATSRPGAVATRAGMPGPGEQQAEADGPGGRQDPPGVNVDHQFPGAE
jgi:hypothetical protein